MKRFQWIELHEQAWMPRFFRNTLTDFLHAVLTRYKVYLPAADLISKVMIKTGNNKILDLCSGGSGPLEQLLPELTANVEGVVSIKLTDKYPNVLAFEAAAAETHGQITYSSEPIDAKKIDSRQVGIRTFFSSFHHFNPSEAKEILRDAVISKSPICIFECTERTYSKLLMDLLVPVSVCLLIPRLKSFGIKQFFFTYFIPVLPLLITVDALVSNVRTYQVSELLAMAHSIDNSEYHWECKKIKSGFNHCNLTYLIGYPN